MNCCPAFSGFYSDKPLSAVCAIIKISQQHPEREGGGDGKHETGAAPGTLEEEACKVHCEYVNGYWGFDAVILLDELTEIRLIE